MTNEQFNVGDGKEWKEPHRNLCTVSTICLQSGENTKTWGKMDRTNPNTPQSCHPPSIILWGNINYFSQQHSPSVLCRGDAVCCDAHLHELQVSLPVSRFRRSVAGLSQRRPGFEPKPVYVRFIADKVLQPQYFSFHLSVSFHQCSIPIHSPTTHTI